MKKIKELWPDQKLILVCRKGIGEFFAKTQIVDQVFEIKKGDSDSYKQVLQALSKVDVERVISPHESLRTAFFVSKIKAREKIAFAKAWNGLFYGQRVRKNYELPDAIRQLSLLQNFDTNLKNNIDAYAAYSEAYTVAADGKLTATPSWASMSLRGFYNHHSADIEKTLAKFSLSREKAAKSVALFPGSVWATKRWTEEGYIQAGQKLSLQGVPVLVMGGPGEEALCARVAGQIPGAVDLCAKTSIYESALVLSQLAAVVGNDSASMHLAATSETPSVVVFGPTVLEFGFRPWQDHVFVVEKPDLECRPCGKHGHKKCPIGTHVCMKSISKDEVLEKLKGVLHGA
ncbi:glycosyltransferase family 9 protein [Bdellovibrio sp. HCB337]|uniref:glycosyltransferase family 9 protein n=1 Tax=Bdellovibrio sp. HCB337 TaxID=3394358 RepID=UPI0039A690CD